MPPIHDDFNDHTLGDGGFEERVFMKIQPVLFDHSTNISNHSNNSMVSVDKNLSNDEDKQAEKMMTPSFKQDLLK